MAPKSLLSLRGEVNWVAGDYSNVIADTKRMVTNANGAALGEMRAGSRQREQHFKQTLGNIDKMEKESGERLVQAKKDIATRVANTRIQARTPIPKEARTTDELKKAGKEIDQVIKAAEGGYARLQGVMKQRGIEGYGGASFADDMGRFGQEEAGTRQMIMDANEETIKLMREEHTELEKNYELMEKKNTSEAYWNRERRKEIDREIAQAKVRGKDMREIDRQSISAEKRERDEMIKTRNLRQRLFGDYRQMKQEELQLERETLQLNREVGEELGRMRQEVGEGLRSAFVYATVAVSAFWYKLQPMVETFQEFENELINAQSIWKESNDVLFALSDQVVEFGQNFGINMGQATEGLYQYASAGVEAAEAMEMLNHTLQLSMAVQGDHNTLAKLTTQTIMGFGMEFSDAAVVTDKFAHAINKSLIEWDDLASSIKFALPFFTSTGQSLDQLLGALAVLTNRALEAGIAGRGLRQALAEFTQHAEDNAAAFNEMGVEILNAEGNMHQLTDIAAQFQNQMGEGVNDMDVMMTLMEDLNIRGATAFVHLVQNADEFQEQVDDLANSSGAAAEMAEIQQKSLQNQIQLVKNALQAPFLMSEDMGANQEYLNSFAKQLHMMVQSFESLIVVENNGSKQLTEFGQFIKNFVIVAMKELQSVMTLVVGLVKSFGDQSEAATAMLNLFTVPIKIVLKLLTALGPELLTSYMIYAKMAQILPLNTMHMWNNVQMRMLEIEAINQNIAGLHTSIQATEAEGMTKQQAALNGDFYTASLIRQVQAQLLMKAALFSMIYLTQKYAKDNAVAAPIIGAMAGALMGYAFALNATAGAMASVSMGGRDMGISFGKSILAGAAAGAVFNTMMHKMMTSDTFAIDEPQFSEPTPMAKGGYVYPRMQQGGFAQSKPYMVGEQGPELFMPSTAGNIIPNHELNQGVTIIIEGDVYDSEKFADKVSEVFPDVLRTNSNWRRTGVGAIINRRGE